MSRLLTSTWLCALLALMAACVPLEPVVDLSKDYSEDTVMGEIQSAGRIIIGIADDAYPLGYVDQNDQPQGFTAQLGREIAERLGVEARFISGSSEQLLDLPKEQAADVTFPALAITEALVDQQYQFSDPYYVAHQRLLVRNDDAHLDTVEELAGERVCSVIDPDTQVTLTEIEPTIDLVDGEPQRCLALLVKGKVRAITASDFLLTGLRLQRPRGLIVTGDQLTTEGLGAVVEKGAAAWVDYVNGVFTLAKQEGGIWLKAYDETIGPGLNGATAEPPRITAEEAAALYPQEI